MKKTYALLSLLVAAAVLTAGCRVGKPYQQPDVELPQRFDSSFADSSSVADIPWKQFFTDPYLQSLIDTAISYNYDLRLALRRIDMAQQQVLQAKALRQPELDVQVTAQYNRPSNNSLSGLSTKNFLGKTHIENYMAVARLSWEADIWGRISAQKEAAAARYLSSREAARAVQTQLVSSVAQAYFNLLMLDKQREIVTRTLALNDSFLVATRLLKDAGLANELAVQQAEAQRLTTALLLPELEQSISLQENALQQLTGRLPGRVARTRSLHDLHLPQKIAAGLPAAVVSRRPDVRVQELALVSANAEVGIATANLYPGLNLSLGGGIESFKASNWFNIPNSLFGLAAGTIAQPILMRRTLKTNLETAKLQREQAVTAFRQSVLNAVTEVSNALVQVQRLKEQESVAAAQVKSLQTAVSQAQQLFRSDMANYLEVITAQSNALQAELNLSAIHRRQWSAVIELYRALGGGWK